MSLDLTDDKSTLVQVMAWCRQATSHYLSQCWPRFMSPYGVTRSQWVNSYTAIIWTSIARWNSQPYIPIGSRLSGHPSANIRPRSTDISCNLGVLTSVCNMYIFKHVQKINSVALYKTAVSLLQSPMETLQSCTKPLTSRLLDMCLDLWLFTHVDPSTAPSRKEEDLPCTKHLTLTKGKQSSTTSALPTTPIVAANSEDKTEKLTGKRQRRQRQHHNSISKDDEKKVIKKNFFDFYCAVNLKCLYLAEYCYSCCFSGNKTSMQ